MMDHMEPVVGLEDGAISDLIAYLLAGLDARVPPRHGGATTNTVAPPESVLPDL
jgi:hypothetical protein